jgi:deoxyadenosine/deoxycytidine kinase
MIIFINGSFGVGKTTIAQSLVHQIPDSLLYDAEEVGLMLRNILKPIDWSGDFQDYPLWRTLVVDVAAMLKQQYNRTLIMPMTIWRQDYFSEVMSELAKIDPTIYHYCLTAPEAVIRERIFERGEQHEGDWIFEQVGKCTAAFQLDLFATHIDTATRDPVQLVDHILHDLRGKPIAE